jgi:hypothetical protein
MFNKTAIIKNERKNFLNNSNPKHYKSYNKKKSLSNLKKSFVNNNNSSNTSNINIKTSSNSKIASESTSIRKVQTITSVRKSLFEDKDKDKEKKRMNQTWQKNLKKKNSNINNQYYYICENNNKHFNNKIRSRCKLNTEENEIQNKAYYLTGEMPFKDKYIVEINNYNSNINISNKNEKNNQIINNKNEFIQCNTMNNNNTFRKKMLNMRIKDKRIDKLAKKLSIKLNLEENKNSNQSKCGCGNLITLNNGFFNGINLVMNYSPIKCKNENDKIVSDNINDVNSNNYNKTEPNIFYGNNNSFIPKNLPLFLRDKYNIKGTAVLSPFCIEARDEFLFKKIFYEKEKKKLTRRTNVIDNKLNIFYAENQSQYNKNLIKLNEKLKKKGKIIWHEVGPSPTEKKLITIRNKMNFMKKIVDYAYPNMVLARVRETEKVYKKKNLSDLYLPPFKKVEIFNKQRNNTLGDYLKKSINIQKKH